MRPSVSHIIPVYNGALHLAEAIASLRPELLPGDEIIVVDDGSTDHSAAIAEAAGEPVRVLREPHLGVNASRNRGLQVARGDWICFLDADDVALPNRLALLGARLLAPDQPDLVYGAQRRFVSAEIVPPGTVAPPEVDDLPAPMAGSLLTWRRTIERHGCADETEQQGWSLAWLQPAMAVGLKVASIPDVVYRRRRHGHNMSLGANYRRGVLAMAQRNLRARRGPSDATR